MVRLKWTEQAVSDLKNIFDFIENDSPKYAILHIRRIREKAGLIRLHPKLGRVVPEYNNEEIREIIFGNYRIIYRIISNIQIDILTVFHTARILKLNESKII